MTQQVVMLDFDGVFCMPAFSAHVEWVAFRAGTSPRREDELPWVKIAPDDTERVTLQGLADGNVYGVVRRSTIDALRTFATDTGVRLVWATSWLTWTERLEAAAAQLGLDFIEIPDLGGVVPFNEPLWNLAGHWKTELVDTFVAAGHRVLWIDDQLQPVQAASHLETLSVIAPNSYFGLNHSHIELIRCWAEGRELGVFDNQQNFAWEGSSALL